MRIQTSIDSIVSLGSAFSFPCIIRQLFRYLHTTRWSNARHHPPGGNAGDFQSGGWHPRYFRSGACRCSDAPTPAACAAPPHSSSLNVRPAHSPADFPGMQPALSGRDHLRRAINLRCTTSLAWGTTVSCAVIQSRKSVSYSTLINRRATTERLR